MLAFTGPILGIGSFDHYSFFSCINVLIEQLEEMLFVADPLAIAQHERAFPLDKQRSQPTDSFGVRILQQRLIVEVENIVDAEARVHGRIVGFQESSRVPITYKGGK